jgi:hypothetical protein
VLTFLTLLFNILHQKQVGELGSVHSNRTKNSNSGTMYLTESEVNVLLQEPLFSLPVTEFKQNYQLYQGHRKVTPRTIRFNLVPNFEPSIIQAYLQEKLTSYYRFGSELSISVQYDFLLCNYNATPKTFYIWRANTNQTTLEKDDDIDVKITLNYYNIKQICTNATSIDFDQLNINFVTSDVTMDRVLAIVFTFCPVT